MPDFSFELEKSPTENIAAFFSHIKNDDPEFAAILEEHLAKIIPNLNDDRLKQQARRDFNNIVIKILDK